MTTRHTSRSAQTRAQIVAAAERLFAERGVDSVSVNEITVAAGQKNRNALQYHFGNREGLLQAIIDHHASRVAELRTAYMSAAGNNFARPSRAAARSLVVPLAEHIGEDASGAHYVKILSQLAALNHALLNPGSRSGITFQNEQQLQSVMHAALSHLKPAEAQRRLFLTVSMTFHGLADICRVAESEHAAPNLARRGALFRQLALSVEAFLAAPALNR